MRIGKTTFALVLLAACGGAWAAGGHHAVDDAQTLDEGRCKVEGWFERARGPVRLLHAGTACRVGAFEFGAAGEYERQSGTPSESSYSLQAKWARDLARGWSVGLIAAPGWQAHVRPRYQGTTVLGLATWAVADSLNLHANLGRDLLHQAEDEARAGASVDWSFREGWQLVAERYRQEGGNFLRAALRWEPVKDWTVDLSRAHHLRGNGASSWTLGLTREFGR